MEDMKTMTQEAWGKIVDDLENSHQQLEDRKWAIDRLRNSVDLLRNENDRLSRKILDLDRENRQLLEVEARSDETAQQERIVALEAVVEHLQQKLVKVKQILQEVKL